MPVTFHRLAAREFVTARRWYTRRSARAAARFVAAVEAAVQTIEANPSAGSSFRGLYRWVRVRRYPYLLYYEEASAGSVTVYAVAHARRRLGYWLRRPRRA